MRTHQEITIVLTYTCYLPNTYHTIKMQLNWKQETWYKHQNIHTSNHNNGVVKCAQVCHQPYMG